MNDGSFVIRQSKKEQFGYLLLTAMFITWYFVGPDEMTRSSYKESPVFTIILGVVFFGLFIHFLTELITRKAEIILTKEGIELRDKGFFTWDMLESFNTIQYQYSDNYSADLVLHFKEFADLKFDISYIEIKRERLVDLILTYIGSSGVTFKGHETK